MSRGELSENLFFVIGTGLNIFLPHQIKSRNADGSRIKIHEAGNDK